MTSNPRIRFTAALITFFDSGFDGLPTDGSFADWQALFMADPRRHFDRMLDGVRDAGLEAIELSPDPGGWLQILQAYGSSSSFGEALADRGLALSSCFAPGKKLMTEVLADPSKQAYTDDLFERHARFARELGAALIVMANVPRSRFGNDSPDDTATAEDFARPVDRDLHQAFADQLNHLGAITARHGVKIVVHTEAYSICTRNGDIATVMSLTDPELVGLCPDAGHITLDGGDPIAVLRDHIDRIPIMHWKDCVGPLSGHLLRGVQKERHRILLKQFRVLGSGIVDWRQWMTILKENKWSGWATAEIDSSPDPIGELRTFLEFYHSNLAPLYPDA